MSDCIEFHVPGKPEGKGRGISIDRLREVIDYSPDTGELRWKIRVGMRGRVGEIAGAEHKGYIEFGLDGIRGIKAHRVAWAITHGNWPDGEIDHINGCKTDNRIGNLRIVSTAQNHQNMRSARCDNKTGLLGVDIHKGRPRAQIQVGGKKKILGYFPTIEAAHAAYVEAKRNLHTHGTL